MVDIPDLIYIRVTGDETNPVFTLRETPLDMDDIPYRLDENYISPMDRELDNVQLIADSYRFTNVESLLFL